MSLAILSTSWIDFWSKSYDLLRPYVVRYIIPALVFIAIASFGVGYLLPRLYIHLERLLWKILLGWSAESAWVINFAVKDYELEIQEARSDEGAQRAFSVLLGTARRVKGLGRLRRDLRRMRDGAVNDMFYQALKKLDQGWRDGTPARLLKLHMTIVKELAQSRRLDSSVINEKEKLRGLCSVALVTYALGDLDEGFRLGKANWETAESLDDRELKWMASYGYHNAEMFRGDFAVSMKKMIELWRTYADLLAEEKDSIIVQLSEQITLHPILTKPRHIILAGAFNDGPDLQDELDQTNGGGYRWPSKESYKRYYREDASLRSNEIGWVEAWYEEAQNICANEPISLNFSHAYVAFYFTLLLGDREVRSEGLDVRLHPKIEGALNSIKDQGLIVSAYVKYGFRGVYRLVCKEYEEALNDLRRASVSSEISGNKFAECIFMCAHALAAARLQPAEEEEIKYYLDNADKLADSIGGNFYQALSAAAIAAVSTLRDDHGRARKYAHRSRQVKKGKRILRIFQPDL